MPDSFNAIGSTLQDLFQDASGKLLTLLIDPVEVSGALREKIVLEASETSALLRDWLNALLSLAAHQRIIFLSILFQELQGEAVAPFKLKAEVLGELIDPLRHTFRRNPRLLTCKDVTLESRADGFAAQIILFY